jgi:hypothetical protein
VENENVDRAMDTHHNDVTEPDDMIGDITDSDRAAEDDNVVTGNDKEFGILPCVWPERGLICWWGSWGEAEGLDISRSTWLACGPLFSKSGWWCVLAALKEMEEVEKTQEVEESEGAEEIALHTWLERGLSSCERDWSWTPR